MIEVIQCKRWAKQKTIHEKDIFQLYGTMVLAKIEDPNKEITGTFTTTTKLSETQLLTMIRNADAHKLSLLHERGGPGPGQDHRGSTGNSVRAFVTVDLARRAPRLLHVVAGRMSLVGPRPLVPEEDALIEDGYRRRLDGRPGITGAWQVAGASRIPLDEMIEMDVDYLSNWSLWLDLKLLFGTAEHVLHRRGI